MVLDVGVCSYNNHIVLGMYIYDYMTRDYGGCLLCMAQIPSSDFATHIRLRYLIEQSDYYSIFESSSDSHSAEYLEDMGYDKK